MEYILFWLLLGSLASNAIYIKTDRINRAVISSYQRRAGKAPGRPISSWKLAKGVLLSCLLGPLSFLIFRAREFKDRRKNADFIEREESFYR